MLNKENAGKWVKNVKTGTQGVIISEYINTRTGKPQIEVAVMGIMTMSNRAYWRASAVVAL